MMSCSSRHGGGESMSRSRRPPASGSGAPALDLLDEYWFFSNTLVKNSSADGEATRRPPRSPSTSVGVTKQHGKELYASGCRRLLRTPSLPSPRVGMPKHDDEVVVEQEEEHHAAAAGNNGHQEAVEVDDDDLNWSSIYEGVLRTRMAEGATRSSSLHRAPSMPVPSSAMDHHRHDKATKSTPSMPRLTHSYSTLHRHRHTPTKQVEQTPPRTPAERRQPRREVRSFSANQQPAMVRSKSAFHDKKWKSSSDLESIEVQGFKDLGFVFDKEELRENLADVLPGLRGKAGSPSGVSSSSGGIDNGVVRRPYLSEAWHHVQRPAALIRVQSEARSAAEMKDQLRMWAQAVACNVRQEC
ncbi:hypothetical protein ACP70R_030786 [Stipagrostis hirtigluma subsp. patula]